MSSKEFITCDMIRDAALKLVHKMHKEDGFVPDIIYDSLRGGAYMANVMSEYYKLIAMKENKTPVFYAAVVARSYGDVREHSNHVDIDGWTVSPRALKKGMKVLIVDDNKINLKVASRLLKDYNIKTVESDSGFECINRILQKEEYDLIFLDDMMPRMSGVETLKKLKEISNFHTPTIALTANAISGMKEKYLKEGFDDYLSKPIDRKELNRVIRKFLNTK